MKLKQLGLALALGAAAAAPASAALVLSEIVANEVGSDTTGEWIEIFNTGATALDLTDYKIGDEETSGGTGATEALKRFPAGASIPAQGVQIVAVSATRFFEVYGFNPTYEVNSTDPAVPDMLDYAAWDPDGGVINMSNTNDQVVLVGPGDTIIDAASWVDSTFAFNPSLPSAADGQSWERINVFVDTDTAADWQLGPNPSGTPAAERSTPGVANVPEPATFALVGSLGLAGAMFRRRR